MKKLFSIRLPLEIYEDLKDEAGQKGITLTDVLCDRLKKYKELLSNKSEIGELKNLLTSKVEIQKLNSSASEGKSQEEDLIALETLFILREMAFKENPQILKKANEELNLFLEKKRKKNEK